MLPETFFKGIFKLAPAHSILFKDGKVTIERYWEPDFDIDENVDFDTLVDKIDAQMNESVQAHMISDVEVGSFYPAASIPAILQRFLRRIRHLP